MKNVSKFWLVCLLTISTSFSVFAQNQFKALLVTTTRGWHHESIHAGVLAIKQLGIKHHFQVDLLEDNYGFTDNKLANYQVVIFLNTTGDIFNEQEQKVMERFIQVSVTIGKQTGVKAIFIVGTPPLKYSRKSLTLIRSQEPLLVTYVFQKCMPIL